MTPVAVVTGAAQGIGRAVCELLFETGWSVVGIDQVASATVPWETRVADVADSTALADALADLPRIDGLVNNAAVQHAAGLLETTPQEWDAVLAVNLRAPFVAVREAASRLATVGGAVVNISSVHALATSANVAPYAASKGGLVAFTRAAALELAGQGVRVNCVAPGAVDTAALRLGFARHVTGDPERVLRERTPQRRLGAPKEIAEAVSFLLDGERSSFITGETIVVDGGVMARLSTE